MTSQLSALPKDAREDTIAFYREFLLNGSFQTKEEIVNAIGTPTELAPKIKQDYNEVAQAAKISQNNASDNYFTGFHVQKNPLRRRNVNPGDFAQVKLNIRQANVFIHQGAAFQVKIADYSSRPIETKLINQTLLITELSAKQENKLALINRHNISSHVEITVPARNSLRKVSGHNHEGEVVLQNLYLQNLTLNLHDGDIYFNNVKVEQEAIVISKNGNLNISQSNILEVSVRTHNGDVTCHRSILNQVILQAINGDIAISQCNLNLNLEAINGDIRIRQSQLVGDNLIRTTNGNLKIQLDHDIKLKMSTLDGNIIYHKSNIGNNFNSNSTQQDSLQVLSQNGDIVFI